MLNRSGEKHRGRLGCARAAIAVTLSIFACLSLARPSGGQTATYAEAEALVRSHHWDEGLAIVLKLLESDPHNTRDLNLAGLAFTGKGDTDHAVEYFKKCLDENPGFVAALKNLGINEFNQGRYEDAEKHLLAAANEAPDDQVINFYVGEISYVRHNFSRAAESLGHARALVQRNPDGRVHLAVSYLETGRQQDALDALDGLDLEQVKPEGQFALGVALEEHDLFARSIPCLEAALRRLPDSYEIGFDLLLDYMAVKDFGKAIELSKGLIARGRETSELNNVLAEAYESSSQTQAAVDALRRAIALAPDDENNYLDFASLCMNHRSYPQAMKVIEAGLETHPKSASILFMRGVLYGMQDEYDLAEKDFQAAALAAPQNDLGFVGLGVTYLEKGNAGEAARVLKKQLRERPNDASLEYLLGEALLRNGAAPGQPEYGEAQSALEKSVKLNAGLCLPHVALAKIYLDEERFKDAATELEQARAIDPKERSAYSNLAVAYRKLGETEKSRSVLTALKDLIEGERRDTREKMKADAQRAGEPDKPE